MQKLNNEPEYQYVYGFFRETTPQTFTNRGMGDRGDPVTSLHYRDLGALISTCPLMEYDSSRRNMLTHTRVQEEAMERFSILPVRFNTVAPNVEKMSQLLRDRYDEFQLLIDEMTGKVEMGLKALWYEGVEFKEILAEHSGIRRLRDALQGRSEEETHYERIHLGERVEKALYQKRQDEERLILEALRPFSCDVKCNPIIGDRMIVNAAFLVEKKGLSALEAAVHGLDEKMGQRILFRLVGPVPLYKFINVVSSWNSKP